MNPRDAKRVGLVGLGGHGRAIQAAAEAARGLQVVSVYDIADAEAASASGRFGCARAPTFEALLATEGLDAVVLVTPNALHRGQAEAAFRAGLDVFVEKPIANTVEDGLAMTRAAEQAGRLLMVGHSIRYGRAARQARALLDRGALGDVVAVEIHYSADNVQKGTHDGWRFQPGGSPLLPMMQLGIHAVDLVHFLVGPVREVAARTRSVLTVPEVVDTVGGLLVFESGVLGTAVSTYCTPDLFQVRLAGTTGVLVVDWIPHRLTWMPQGNRTVTPEVSDFSAHAGEELVAEMEAFARALSTREAPETDGRVGLQALAVVEAMVESTASGGFASVADRLGKRPAPHSLS